MASWQDYISGLLGASNEPPKTIEEIREEQRQRAENIPAAQWMNKLQAGEITTQPQQMYDTPIVPSPMDVPPVVDMNRPSDKVVDMSGFVEAFAPQEIQEQPMEEQPVDIEEEEQEQIAKEVSQADEIKKEADKLEVQTFGEEPEESTLDKEPTDLEKAQARRDDIQAAMMMLKGLTQIGTSVATRGKGKLPEGYLNDAMKLAENQVANLKEQQEARVRDIKENILELQSQSLENKQNPAHAVSTLYRDNLIGLAEQAGVRLAIPENASAADLEKIFPTLTNLISAKQAQDARKEASEERKLQRELAQAEKRSDRRFADTQKEAKEVSKIDKELQYSLTRSNVDGLKSKLAEGDNSGLWDVEAIYAFIKAIDPGSVVREGEVKLFQGAEAFFDQIANKPRNWMQGQLQSPRFRKRLMTSLEKIADAREQNFKTQTKAIYNRSKARELDLDQVFGDYSNMFESKKDKTETKLAPGERLMRDRNSGRNVVVDEQNNVLRWAD